MSNAWNAGSEPEHGAKLSTTQARQGTSGLGVRYVLAISLSTILAIFAILYFIYAGP